MLECKERLVDLEEVFKKDYCHPDFHGRTSIKQTLPAVVPEMTYDGMEIADGNINVLDLIALLLAFGTSCP